ncbi:RNA exonuclease 4-like [Ctenocephalides felis]|uniref:RNA exonuclease 4-like n=1 Tax=Ctenocephalides felis TaxID=7515 RepID=UPI000E6E54D5|nr:RNA exonuclease 4-like [Ctenocephalides felis]
MQSTSAPKGKRKRGKKSKSQTKDAIQKTKLSRNEIGANWKSFLSTQSLTKDSHKDNSQKTEKYSGPFRRARKLESLIQMNQTANTTDTSENSTFASQGLTSDKKEDKRNQPLITKYVAMDCEMVGVGEEGKENMLARVSIVNKHGDCIYDKFVAPREEVVDYRTSVSGVRPSDLKNATEFDTVAKEVASILQGKILVGHALHHDLDALLISHPRKRIRDTSRYKPFRSLAGGRTPGLRKLAKLILGVDIQKGEHSSVEDAKAAMQIYISHSKQWEEQIRRKPAKV